MFSKAALADSALLLVTIIWGTTFIVVKNALADIPPFTFIAIRFILAFAFMALIFHRRLFCRNAFSLIKLSGIIGLVLFSSFAFQTVGLLYTTASNSAFITGLAVVFVPLVGMFWGQKAPDIPTWIGILCALTGLGLLTLNADFQLNWGDFLTLLCAITGAFHIVMVAEYAPKVDAPLFATLQIGTVAVASSLVGFSIETFSGAMTEDIIIALSVTALPATVFAFLTQSMAQKYTTATRTALIFTLEPVFAGLFSYILLGELLSGRQMIGCVLMIFGTLLSETVDYFRGIMKKDETGENDKKVDASLCEEDS